MKYLLLSFLIVSSVAAMAQADLFVRPNPTSNTDSYVYVSDVELYVEDNIELKKNINNTETAGSIYLRNNGQLIQGSETARNSGDGMLSVYQSAEDSDQWTYNYWCYPVGKETGPDGHNTWSGLARVYGIDETSGSPSITSSFQADNTSNLNGFTNPGTTTPVTISTRWIYKHPRGFEAENDYIRVGASNAVPPGWGFTMKGVGVSPNGGNDPSVNTGAGYTYDFRGRPNTGEIEIPVYWSSLKNKGEYTLSGNPYPSALDLNRLWYDPANLDASGNSKLGEILYWDEDKTSNSHFYSENAGGYGSWIPMGSEPNGTTNLGMYTRPTFSVWNANGDMVSTQTGPNGAIIERRFAPIGQGFFFVPASDLPVSEQKIVIKNAHRRYIPYGDKGSTFRKPTMDTNDNGGDTSFTSQEIEDDTTGAMFFQTDNRVPHFRINAFFDKSHVRDMVLAFSDEATDFYDNGFDATSPMDASSEAYFPVGPDYDRKPYVINTVPFNVKKQIPIAFKLDKQFKFWIETVEEVKMRGQKAYIFDREENTYQEFTNGKSATYNLPAGTYDNRFFIVFKGEKEAAALTKETQERAQQQVDFFQNNQLGVLEVKNPEGYDIKQALVFDISGKLVYQKKNIGTERFFSFPTSNLSDGVYIVKLKTADNIDINYKASVYNKN